jgi:hypothetical protein
VRFTVLARTLRARLRRRSFTNLANKQVGLFYCEFAALNHTDCQHLREQIRALGPDSGPARSFRDQALAATNAGDLDETKRLLDGYIEARSASVSAANKFLRSVAAAEAALGWIAMAQSRYSDAAKHFRIACRSLPEKEIGGGLEYRRAEVDSYYRQGFAAGDTEDEAIAAARKSLMLFAEDMEDDGERLPKPRTIAELRRDKEVRESFADGDAFFIAVPLIRNTGRTRRVALDLDVALIEMIDHVRGQANLTRKAWFEQLARNCVFAYFTGTKPDNLVRFKGRRAVA